jgi:hypothetical protein
MTKRRNDEVNLFKALMNEMHGRTEDEEEPKAIAPEGKPVIDVEAETITEPKLLPAAPAPAPQKPKKTLGRPKKSTSDPNNTKKRGRPATGKRSDRLWYGRTFYVRKTTDEIIERALFDLKRRGVDLDKSDLTDALLAAWAAVYLNAQDDFPMSDILKYLPDRDVEEPEFPPEEPELAPEEPTT